LCAYKHEWPLRAAAGFLETAKMNEDTQKLWIELDGAEEDGMFYLASPCKADLTVRKTTCQCKEYFDSETVYSNIVIQASAAMENPHFRLTEEYPTPVWIETFRVEFPKDKDKDEFVHKFKYPSGKSVRFTYMPEGSTSADEWKEITLKDGDDVNDPVMLEQALRSMDKEALADWIVSNSRIRKNQLNQYLQNDAYLLEVIDRYENNYGQNTVYKSCVKGTWWKPWEPADLNVDCIKIKAEGC
jgi:hypothetical protein